MLLVKFVTNDWFFLIFGTTSTTTQTAFTHGKIRGKGPFSTDFTQNNSVCKTLVGKYFPTEFPTGVDYFPTDIVVCNVCVYYPHISHRRWLFSHTNFPQLHRQNSHRFSVTGLPWQKFGTFFLYIIFFFFFGNSCN